MSDTSCAERAPEQRAARIVHAHDRKTTLRVRDDAVAALGARVHLLGAGVERVIEVIARRRRMRSTELHALLVIAAAESGGDAATPGDLAQALRLTTGAITGIVDRLVRAGHVRRHPDGADRRRVRLACREAGREVTAELLGTLGNHASGVLTSLAPDELAIIDRVFDELATALTAYLLSPQARTAGEQL
ncbi:MarR family winged helix-turn-helix transcriptional regulator [Pseudonocardia sp. RS010]|uniref:MarR family winged helix-turn-helix transcriptional regulator n=1 Tax=Pseudonocardia sp. RS010 TaxID=3385979 RepID=UPI0039A2F22E